MSEEFTKGLVDGAKKQGITCWYALMIGLSIISIINNVDSLKKL